MNITLFGCAVGAAFFAAPLAQAQSVNANAPQSVANALSAAGYSAELGTDEYGDPKISSNYDGINFTIYFYGCDDGSACQDLQFRASFQTDRINHTQMNTWNRDKFMGKAYVTDNGSSIVEHPVAGVDGMSRYAFDRTLRRWESVLDGFVEAIGWE